MILLLAACWTVPVVAPDADADGWEDAVDCAPEDPTVHRGAPEVCDGVDQDCDGDVDEGVPTRAWYHDADGDGFGSGALPTESCAAPSGSAPADGDCDDSDATVFPGAAERCDGQDHDCDGRTDDAPPGAGFADRDGDGYGDPAAPLAACPGEPGVVADATDCDDTLAGVHPGAGERCVTAGRDDDCDGLVDDADPDVADLTAGWPDRDGDGYGDTTVAPRAACVLPDGEVPDGTDCDDTRLDVHPGADEPACTLGRDYDCDGLALNLDGDADGYSACADCDDGDAAIFPGAPEVCDEADDNCDGQIDEGVVVPTWFLDADGDGYGRTDVSVTRCDAPADAASDGGDCDDDHASVHPGATETCFTSFDDDCDGVTSYDGAPDCTDFWLDADRDGYGDASAGARCLCDPEGAWIGRQGGDCDDRDPERHPGAADVCGSGVDADCDGWVACPVDDLPRVLSGSEAGAHLGEAVVVDADLDGDGRSDLLVGEPGVDGEMGRVRAFRDGAAPDLAVAAWEWTTLGTPPRFGAALAAGDGDGDGVDEVFVGLPDLVRSDFTGRGAVVQIVAGPPADGVATSVTTSSAITVWFGDSTTGTFGTTFAWAADIAGEGEPILAIADAAPLSGEDGTVYLERVSARERAYPGSRAALVTPEAGGSTGRLLAVRDVDGDGVPDLLTDTGSGLALLLGPLAGTVDTSAGDTRFDLDGVTAARLVDDVDGDGRADLVSEQRAAVLLFTTPVTLHTRGAASALWAGAVSVGGGATPGASTTGDFNGDGTTDLATREADADAADPGVGRLLVFPGPLTGTATAADAPYAWQGDVADSHLGWRTDPVGDLDGDGRDDLLVGLLGSSSAGELRLLWGSLLP